MILFPKTVTIKRESGGSRLNGKWVHGAESTLNIIADVQPLNGTDLIELGNIGRKQHGTIKIYTTEDLKITTEGVYDEPDRFVWNNLEYEIIWKAKFDNNLLNHNKYYAELRTGITQ